MSSFDDNLKQVKNQKGVGIITTVEVPKGHIIFEFKGDVVKTLDIPPKADLNYYLQIGKDLFLSPSGAHDDYINHSCSPNCGAMIIGNRAFLISICLIKAGVELTFDYATTSTDTIETWSMTCMCGVYGCRKVISGYNYLPEATQKYYQSLNIIPNYVRGI
jgi:hypothetical protein